MKSERQRETRTENNIKVNRQRHTYIQKYKDQVTETKTEKDKEEDGDTERLRELAVNFYISVIKMTPHHFALLCYPALMGEAHTEMCGMESDKLAAIAMLTTT